MPEPRSETAGDEYFVGTRGGDSSSSWWMELSRPDKSRPARVRKLKSTRQYSGNKARGDGPGQAANCPGMKWDAPKSRQLSLDGSDLIVRSGESSYPGRRGLARKVWLACGLTESLKLSGSQFSRTQLVRTRIAVRCEGAGRACSLTLGVMPL